MTGRHAPHSGGEPSAGQPGGEPSTGPPGGEPRTPLPGGVVAGYAVGSVGTGGFGVLPGLVLAYYLTDSLAVPAVWATAVVLIPKLVDIAISPLIGAHSDRMRQATGGRTRGMFLGALLIAPLFALTFAAPTGAGAGVGALWVLAFFTLAAVAYSLFQVPYVALPADLTGQYHERTRLVATRIVVLAATILLVGAGGPAIRDLVGGAGGYLAMGVIIGLVIGAGMLIATVLTRNAASRNAASRKAVTNQPSGQTAAENEGAVASYRLALAAFAGHRPFRILLSVYVIQALASAVMLAGGQYVATYLLGDAAALTFLFVALIAPALLVMPLWYRLGVRLGKPRALQCASALFVVGSGVLVLAFWSPGGWIFGAVAVAGIGYAGMQTFPLALLPDVIDDHSRQIGADRGGAMSGLWTGAETGGLALGPAVFLLILAATGFVSSGADEVAAQPDSAIAGIAVGFSAIPAVLVAFSLILLRGFDAGASAARAGTTPGSKEADDPTR